MAREFADSFALRHRFSFGCARVGWRRLQQCKLHLSRKGKVEQRYVLTI